MSAKISALRYSVEPGDIPGAIRVLLDDYEQSGDMMIRVLALEHRFPDLTEVLTLARAGHREWVAYVFEPYLPPRGPRRDDAIPRRRRIEGESAGGDCAQAQRKLSGS